ncbi:MAG: hypothetical protein ACRYG8_17025, partial [Janthinobacterium lividum]
FLSAKLITLSTMRDFHFLKPGSESLVLSGFGELGYEGLKEIVREIKKRKHQECRFKEIALYDCGLGGASK